MTDLGQRCISVATPKGEVELYVSKKFWNMVPPATHGALVGLGEDHRSLQAIIDPPGSRMRMREGRNMEKGIASPLRRTGLPALAGGKKGCNPLLHTPLFQETSEFLDGQPDELMRRYKTENPTFHAGYEAARVVFGLRGPGEPDEPEPEPVPRGRVVTDFP